MGGGSHGDGAGADQQRDDVEQVRKVPEDDKHFLLVFSHFSLSFLLVEWHKHGYSW